MKILRALSKADDSRPGQPVVLTHLVQLAGLPPDVVKNELSHLAGEGIVAVVNLNPALSVGHLRGHEVWFPTQPPEMTGVRITQSGKVIAHEWSFSARFPQLGGAIAGAILTALCTAAAAWLVPAPTASVQVSVHVGSAVVGSVGGWTAANRLLP